MTKREISELLYARLGPLFPGFRLNKRAATFARRIDDGSQRVGVPLVDHQPLFKFSLVFSIRLETVEAIVNSFNGALPKAFADTITSATRLDYFFPGTDRKQYEVRSEADVDAAVRELAPIVREQILPFLDEHRSAEALDRAMNFGDPKFDRLNEPYRSMSALTVARLSREPRFAELVNRYRLVVQACPPHDRDKLEKLIAHLETLPG